MRSLIPAAFACLAFSLTLAACSAERQDPRAAAMRHSTDERGSSSISAVPPDGGDDYFTRFPGSLPSDAGFFPIGVWFESVTDAGDVETDRAAGINTYVALTANSDLSLVHAGGMHAIPQVAEWVDRATGSDGVGGWLLGDEVDMTHGAEDGLRELEKAERSIPASDGRLRYSNFGKGVMFWQEEDDAARLVNYLDVISADNYWFTDRNICRAGEGGALLAGGERALSPQECHLAANYGRTVTWLRSLVEPPGSKPIWNFVEVGHPAGEDDWPTIRPEEVRAAVWSGIINGARGVVYFNHSFGGPAQTQHALREPGYADVRGVVTRVNRQIEQLAPVLNSPTVLGLANVRGDANSLVKLDDRYVYLLAGSTTPDAQDVSFSVPCSQDQTVTVLGEGRQVRLSDHVFSDRFADGNAVHIYRFPRSQACQPS